MLLCKFQREENTWQVLIFSCDVSNVHLLDSSDSIQTIDIYIRVKND